MNDRGPRWAWLDRVTADVRAGELSSSAAYVAHILAVHYMNEKGEAWPSQPVLAAASGLSIATVRRSVRELEAHGLQVGYRGYHRSRLFAVENGAAPALAESVEE